MDKLKLLVLFGGPSEEHAVSIRSATSLAIHLNPNRYDPYYVYLSRGGAWLRVNHPAGALHAGEPVALTTKGLLYLEGDGIERVDIAFPMLHGALGEDGAIQGLLECFRIPYVGCGVAASALCIDKALTYLVAAAAGVDVPRHMALAPGMNYDGRFGYPVFVKPARSGSSFGVSKVSSAEELAAAIALARRYDEKVLVEEAVIGEEVGCAMLGHSDDPITGALDQIMVTEGFFRIHQQENPESGPENASIRVPAALSPETQQRALHQARRIYAALGLDGLARVDLFLTKDGRVVLNEVNTMPGFTTYSRYPRMMEASGRSMREVVDCLIDMTMKKE